MKIVAYAHKFNDYPFKTFVVIPTIEIQWNTHWKKEEQDGALIGYKAVIKIFMWRLGINLWIRDHRKGE